MTETYVFDSSSPLARHLLALNPNISNVRLQKTLYFMFALYGATYGQTDEIERVDAYPTRLFPASYSAWEFGPVEERLHNLVRKNQLMPRQWAPAKTADNPIYDFINDVYEMTNRMSDFELIERSLRDQAWKDARESQQGVEAPRPVLDNKQLINEYAKDLNAVQ